MRPDAPPLLQHADAVHHRQADVENNGVVRFGVAEKVAFLAVLGRVDDVAGIGERGNQLAIEVGIILDNQQTHRRTPFLGLAMSGH